MVVLEQLGSGFS